MSGLFNALPVARPSRTALLGLYRDMLRAIVHFPTMRKENIAWEIRAEWRKNRISSARTDHQIQEALRGLEMMNKYVKLDKKSNKWDVHL